MFDAYKQANQNQFQLKRDNQQNAFGAERQRQQNDFQMGRDKTLFEQQQQMQEAERQRKFMDEARQQSGRFIMDSIENGEYDPQTARELRQNLIDEAEALGNPNLDATQRAEALNAIRGRRTVLSANRQPKAAPPTEQEQFDQGVVTDPESGMRFRRNAKGDYDPLPQQQKAPASANEAFSADPKIRDKYMADAIAIETKGGEVPLDRESRKRAAETARQLWEEDNLPSAAPGLPGAGAPATPGAERSILEPPTDQGIPVTPPDQGVPPSPGIPVVPPDEGVPPSPSSGQAQPPSPMSADYDAEMTAKGYMLVAPPDGSRPYYYKTDSTPMPTSDFSAQPSTPQRSPMPLTSNASSQNPWNEAAGIGTQAAAAPTPAPTPAPAQAVPPQTAMPVKPPDFTALATSAPNDQERTFFTRMQSVYQQQTPDVQAAISVLLNTESSDVDAAQALEYLQSKGIDLNQLAKESSVKETTRETMTEKYGENYDSF